MNRTLAIILIIGLFKNAGAAHIEKLWQAVDRARQITFHSYYRHPGFARRVAETRALEEIVRLAPGGLDEARARSALAEICSHGGNAAVRMEHRYRAQTLLRELMKKQPGLAGFMLGRERIIKERQAYRTVHQKVVERYGDTHWGQYAQLHLLKDDTGRPLKGATKPLFEFEKRHRGDELGLRALKSLSFWFGHNKDQRGINPVPNWTQAMEVNLLIARHYPAARQRSFELYGFEPKFSGDARRLEELFEQYIALNLGAWSYHLRQLAKAKGLPEDSPEFYIAFWDAVERRCEPDGRAAVAAGRARFFYSEGRYKREHKSRTEFFGASRRVLKDYPKSVFAAEMLDLMACAMLEQKDSNEADHAEATKFWRQLLETYPDHPVCRWIAVDLASLEKLAGSLAEQRSQLEAVLKNYPSDTGFDIAIPYLIGESFEREKKLGPALRYYQRTLDAWDKMSPALRGDYLSIWFASSQSLPWQVRFSFVHQKIREKVALWRRFESTEFHDLLAWQAIHQFDGKVRREGLEQFLKDFPRSTLAAEAKCELARQYELAKEFDKARKLLTSIIDNKSSRHADVLIARLAISRMNILKLGAAPKLDKKQTTTATKLISQLGAETFAKREAAAKQLLALGPAVHDLLDRAAKSKDLEVRARARSVMQGVLAIEMRTALQDYEKTLRDKQTNELVADAAAIHRVWWHKQRERWKRYGPADEQQAPQEPSPTAWSLVPADTTIVFRDGRQQDVELSHRFEPLKNAATLHSADMMRVARALNIPTKLTKPPTDKDPPKSELKTLFEQAREQVLPSSRLRHGIHPVIFFGPAVHMSQIHFLNDEQTKAQLHFRYGASGGSERLEKKDGKWIIVEGKGSRWIS